MSDFYLESIQVCYNYSDFLELTLPTNKLLFDNNIVVTHPSDTKTIDLCKKEGVFCVQTEVFYKDGAKFNFGAARAEGMKYLKYNDWLWHLDCDCLIVNKDLKKDIPFEFLNSEIMYGFSRRFLWTYQDYLNFTTGKTKLENYPNIAGYGCGFSQLTSRKSKIYSKYPDLYPEGQTAENVDIIALKRFHPNVLNVGKLDMVEILHCGPHGVNNPGREFSKIPEGKLSFKEMPDLSKHKIYE